MSFNNLYLRFHRWLTNIWVYFISLAFIVCAVFLIVLFLDPDKENMHHTFYLFGINTVDESHSQWTFSSLIVGIIGIVIFNGLLITAFSSGVERYVERIRDGRKRFWLKNHYVMIGYNHYSSSIIERILGKENSQTKLVILTSKVADSVRTKLRASLSEEIDNRVIIYSGDGNTDKHVSKLDLDKAIGVYIMVEGNEWENQYTQSMTLLKEIESYASNHSIDADTLLPVNLFINETSAFNLVQRLSLPFDYLGCQAGNNSQSHQNIDLHIFNFYDNWARLLWSYNGRKEKGKYVYDSLDFEPIEGTNKYIHLVIVGFNSMGRALLLEALRICHYPNFEESTNENKSLVTIIDPEAEKLEDQWYSQYPNYNQIKDICVEFVPSTFESKNVRESLCKWCHDSRELLTIAICLSDPDAAMTMALSLPEDMFFNYEELELTPNKESDPNGKQIVIGNPIRPRILVRQNVKRSVSDIISFNSIAYKNVKLFGTFLNGFDEDLLNDDLSICVNGIYSDTSCSMILSEIDNVEKKLLEIPYESKFDQWKHNWLDYEQTPETNKMSTRYQTDHYRTLLPILERAKYLKEDDKKSLMDLLACAEHRRWIAERTLAGWRQAKEGEKRIDSLKIHTCIVPHTKLPQEEFIKDRNVVAFAPILVDFVNKRKKKI